jgi:hypothetical protein
LLLNDVQAAHRFAYLLGPTLTRYSRKRKAQRKVRLAVLGAGVVVGVFVWVLVKGY